MPTDMAVSPGGQNVAVVGAGNDRVMEISIEEVKSFDAIDNCDTIADEHYGRRADMAMAVMARCN